MTSSDIVIKIYNQKTLRVDLGEKWIKQYAMNVAHTAYIRGHNDALDDLPPRPEVSLSLFDPDKINDDSYEFGN